MSKPASYFARLRSRKVPAIARKRVEHIRDNDVAKLRVRDRAPKSVIEQEAKLANEF